ncbi:MAG: hypothetical protein WC828_04270, partial [Thermoleophilia bacterium]
MSGKKKNTTFNRLEIAIGLRFCRLTGGSLHLLPAIACLFYPILFVSGNTDASVLEPKGYDSLTSSTCEPPWGVESRITVSAR